jgi:hypothetical protein
MLRSTQKLLLMLGGLVLAVELGCTGFFVNPTLSSLSIGPSNQTITVVPKQTLQMSATGSYSDGSSKDLTGKVSWSSGTASCATISSSGLVTPVSSVTGICTTAVTAAFGTVTSSSVNVTVTEGAPTQITLTATPTNPAPNSSVTFKALATFPNNATQQDVTTSVTWNNTDTTDLTLTNGSTTGTISATAAVGTQINVTASFGGVNSNTVTLTIQ